MHTEQTYHTTTQPSPSPSLLPPPWYSLVRRLVVALIASYPLTPPLPFASCTPLLPFASCLPAGCHVALVVALPPTPPRDFASTSSLSQLATPHLSRRRRLSSSCRLCLATRHLRLSTRRRLITGCVVARRRCADVVAVDAHASSPSSRLRLSPSAIVALVARRRAGVVVIVVVFVIDVDVRCHCRCRRIPLRCRHCRRLRRPSRCRYRATPS